jgi:uncharacterized protein YndB with AHSA1/START domain
MKNFVFEPDMAAKKIHVSREFSAPVETVWAVWTDRDVLDKWWGPKPWKVVSKVMDFTVGGVWLFAMVGPDGNEQCYYVEFTAIEEGSAISSIGRFCEAGSKVNFDGPKSYRDTKFSSIGGNRTKVELVLSFDDEATFKRFAEGGCKEGFSTGYDQLDELLAANSVQLQTI